jgi:hypothetical protein
MRHVANLSFGRIGTLVLAVAIRGSITGVASNVNVIASMLCASKNSAW